MTPDMEGFKEKLLRRSNSQSTVKTYSDAVARFTEFSQSRYGLEIESMIDQLQSGKLDTYKVLDAFVGWASRLNSTRGAKRKLKPATIQNFVKGTIKFLRYHDVEILNEKIKDKVTMPSIEKIDDVPIEPATIRRLIESEIPLQGRLAIGIMKDAGTRIGETLQLRLKDIHLDENPVRIEIRKEYVKSTRQGRKAREVFITPETVRMLKEYLLRYENKIEKRHGKIFGYSDKNFRTMLYRHLKKLDIDSKIENHVYHEIHPHIFRKFFYSQVVGIIGEQAAHGFMGHGTYLDTYYKRSLEDRRADYRKCIPKLEVLEASNEDQFRRKAFLDRLRFDNPELTDVEIKRIEQIMFKKNLAVPDAEAAEEIREIISQQIITRRTGKLGIDRTGEIALQSPDQPIPANRKAVALVNEFADPETAIKYALSRQAENDSKSIPQNQERNTPMLSGNGQPNQKRIRIKQNQIDEYLAKGYEPIFNLPNGDVVVRLVG